MGEANRNKFLNNFLFTAIPGAYSQIFFSNNKWFALLLLLASFLDPYCGFSGLAAVVITNLCAKFLGLNNASIQNGLYSFNSLLAGLMLGHYYNYSIEFFQLLILASLLTLFVTIFLESQLSKTNLPFLSLPFMITVWAILLSGRSFGALTLNERGIFSFNELWNIGGENLVHFYENINALELPLGISVYFKSLGAIFFQANIISGILIALGLLLYSRIAFSLSLLGFFTGYLFYYFIGGDFSDIYYSFIGFNFILSAIAIGGFFTIPSPLSYLLVIAITPLTGIISSALGNFFDEFQLPVYSLPFNIIVIITLAVLRNRVSHGKLELVMIQQFSPEKNLYKHKNRIERFRNDTYFHIHLPFYGEWIVSQGHAGKHTHKGDWQYALDFVVTDETKKTFRPPGEKVEDFYCYNLPILAPAAGYVINIVDEVEDNPVGEVDIAHNWGNTIVIKHNEYLFSKISHIKKGSFKVKTGDYVKKGDLIANCGNSGRSPEPHIHFQLQPAPFIGTKTLKYPVCYYISNRSSKINTREKVSSGTDKNFVFHAFDYPAENEIVTKPVITSLIGKAFNFTPGQKIHFKVTNGKIASHDKSEGESWEVFVDSYNNPYIYCHNTKSYAYFVNNETLHYFTDFAGDKNSLLYYFYLGAHKILLGYYHRMEISDKLPVEGIYSGFTKIIQDFIAPFHLFLKAEYSSMGIHIDDASNPAHIEISSSASVKTGNITQRKVDFRVILKNNRIERFMVSENDTDLVAEQV